MAEPLPGGVELSDGKDHVRIAVPGGVWEGTAAEAERVLTGLQYAVGRARPGTGIASMYVNDALWGGKFFEPDPDEAIREMRSLIDKLARRLESMETERASVGGSERSPRD